MDEATMSFAKQQGRQPKGAELAAMLGVTEREVEERQAQAASSMLLYIDHSAGDEPGIGRPNGPQESSGGSGGKPCSSLTPARG